jgi:hypothetical protein
MPNLDMKRCKAGDLLLFYGFNAVRVGQLAVRAVSRRVSVSAVADVVFAFG